MVSNEEFAQRAVRACRRRGADQAEALVVRQTERAAGIFNQEIQLSGVSDVTRITLRLFREQRGVVVTGQGLSEQALDNMVEQATAMSRQVSPDKYFGEADAREVGKASGDLKIFDPQLAQLPQKQVEEIALAGEAAVARQDSRLAHMVTSNCQVRTQEVTLCTSQGFCDSYQATTALVSLNAVTDNSVVSVGAEPTSKNLIGAGNASARWLSALNVDRAAVQTVEQMKSMAGARSSPAGSFPVIFAPAAARNLAVLLIQLCSGPVAMHIDDAVLGRIGEQVCSPMVTLVDDATKEGGMGTVRFDHEGVAPQRKVIIEQGVLKQYLLNSYYARALQRTSTGNAVASTDARFSVLPTNAYLERGSANPADLLAGIRQGLYVTRFLSQGTRVAANFTQTVAGFWIEDGKLTHPVRAAALSMPFKDLFKGVVAVGNDLADGVIASPTIMMGRMSISPLV